MPRYHLLMLHGLSFSPHGLLLLLAALAGVAVALAAAAAVLMAQILLRPPRMTDGKAAYVLRRLSPGDLRLPFEELRWTVRDARSGQPLDLAAWWIPHPRAEGRTIVLIHGYADAKVGSIAWAPALHATGLNLLALDLRAHGESGGRYSTAGYFERHDVDQAINQLQSQRPQDAKKVALFGASMGAAVAAATACVRGDVVGVVMECPYRDYATAARRHATGQGFPAGLLQGAATRLAELFSGANFAEVAPVRLIPQVPCPLMLIQACDDFYVSPEDAAALVNAAESRPAESSTVIWRIDAATHLRGMCLEPLAYQKRLEEFLIGCFERTGQAPQGNRKVMKPAP